MALFCAAIRRDSGSPLKCPFIAVFRNSRVRFQQFVTWNIHTVFFLLISVDLLLFFTGPLAHWVECSSMARETGVLSQVKSYKKLKKCYLISPCLTPSIIRHVSRVKWSNPGKWVAPSLHLGVVAIEKGAFGSPSTSVTNFSFLLSFFSSVDCFSSLP